MSEPESGPPGGDSLLRAPPGAVSHVGIEARLRRRVEAAATGVFRGWGYEEILPPLFDHAEVFARGGGRWSERSSYRFTEGGDLLALRADFTALAARVTAARLPEATTRIYYRGEVVRRPGRRLGPSALREAGVEHFAAGPAADLEALLVAFEVLERLGVEGFVFTLGHAAFPLALLDLALASGTATPERRAAVRAETLRGLYRRDRGRIEAALGRDAGPVLSALDLAGGPEVLAKAARDPALPQRALRGVRRLEEIAGVLDRLGLGERFGFDLAELRGFDYYTGLIFEIHAPGAGGEIGGGGRYDDLMGKYGPDRPAVGFTLSVDRIAGILRDRHRPELGRAPDPEAMAFAPGDLDAVAGALERARAARAADRPVRLDPSRGDAGDPAPSAS